MTDYPLKMLIKTAGDWFVPEEPSHRVPGVLEYDGQLSLLNLSNSFEPVIGKVTAGYAKRYPIVHGATSDLGEVTLFDAVQVGLGFNIVEGQVTQPERLRAPTLIIGRHVGPAAPIKSMAFRIPGLEIWLSRQVIWNTITPPTKDSSALQTVRIVPPAPESINVPTIDGTVSFEISVPMSVSYELTRFSIAATGTLTITSNSGQTLAWFLDHYAYIEALIVLLAGGPMPVDQIQARFTDENADRSILLALPKTPPCTAATFNDFFIPRGVLGTKFEGLIQRWFEEKSKLQLSVGLASNVLASQDLWTHLEFLSLLQALEGFHRAIFPGIYMADVDYEKVKKALGDAIPPNVNSDHRAALRSRIRYGNQVSLRKRMNGLLDWLSARVRQLALGSPDAFPGPWIDTRNFFTHWDKELEQNVLTGQALYEANVRLRILLRVVYLHFVGVDPQVLEKALVSTSPLAQHLTQLNFPDTPMLEIKPVDHPAAPEAACDPPLVAGQAPTKMEKAPPPTVEAPKAPDATASPKGDAA